MFWADLPKISVQDCFNTARSMDKMNTMKSVMPYMWVGCLLLLNFTLVGCYRMGDTPSEIEQEHFDRTMEEVGAPAALEREANRNAAEFD